MDQTIQGKAYEYACLLSIMESVRHTREVVIMDNSSLRVAKNAWESLGESAQELMHSSSMAGVVTLIQLEPKIIEDGTDLLEVSLQEDRAGKDGDVRDIVIIRRDIKWEIGISVKHNHSAIKHSRLSPTINFGKDWLDISCSDDYFAEINPIFKKLNDLKEIGLRWNEIKEKNHAIYVPLLKAFMNELTRIDQDNPGLVPARLLEYLLGRKDFYKIISNDANRFTNLQCFNLHKTLNTSSTSLSPTLKVRGVEMPSLIYHLDFKNKNNQQSDTTIELVMNNGWTVTFRIHNASTYVENSLKFDIQLIGVPDAMFSNSVSW